MKKLDQTTKDIIWAIAMSLAIFSVFSLGMWRHSQEGEQTIQLDSLNTEGVYPSIDTILTQQDSAYVIPLRR